MYFNEQTRIAELGIIYLPIHGSTALVELGRLFSFLIYTQSVGLFGRGISQSEGRYPHSEQNKQIKRP
jgi:hypothetical protein